MNEKEMIEEMAKDIFEYVDTKKQDDVYILHSGIAEGMKPLTHNYGLAEFLHSKNYRKIPEGSVVLTSEQYEELQENISELKNLEWYKYWHKKHKKEIEDLTVELETYRPTKLSGNGQCKCSKCGRVSWTDWFSRYKGQILCNNCLKELIEKDNNDSSKEMTKEILQEMLDFIHNETFRKGYELKKVERKIKEIAKIKGVEVEE